MTSSGASVDSSFTPSCCWKAENRSGVALGLSGAGTEGGWAGCKSKIHCASKKGPTHSQKTRRTAVQHLRQLTAIPAVSLLLPISLCAQWLRTPGIPRTSDGKPNLAAPAPRTPDGKPDLSGRWRGAPNLAERYPYVVDVIQEIKDEAIFKPAAEAVLHKRLAELGRDWPPRHCLPFGPAESLTGTYRIIQSPTVVALLFNSDVGDDYRQIFLDGRELPKDRNPTPACNRALPSHRFRTHGSSGHLWVSAKTSGMLLTWWVRRRTWAWKSMRKFCRSMLARMSCAMRCPDCHPAFRRPTRLLSPVVILYVGALPLIPQSETRFQEFDGSVVEFSRDANGAVTGLTRSVGDLQSGFFRKR
jgi:hypothetical protein